MDRFTIDITNATVATQNARLTTVAFGDGYEQRAPEGINSKRLSFDWKFSNVTAARVRQVVAFLDAHPGVTAFLWLPPIPYDDLPRAFIVRPPWTLNYNSFDNYSLAVRIDEDFNPSLRCDPVVITSPGDMITMACATAGAFIRFTTGETGTPQPDPTELTGTPYVAPFAGADSTTYKAIAWKADRLPSAVTAYDFAL